MEWFSTVGQLIRKKSKLKKFLTGKCPVRRTLEERLKGDSIREKYLCDRGLQGQPKSFPVLFGFWDEFGASRL